MHRHKILLILIVLILLIILILMYNKSDNKSDNKLNYKNLRNNIHKKYSYPKSDYVLEIDDPDLSFSDNVMTSVDTINLYPSQYPYTFGYKPYYYRLYPYPLRPQYHYHKKEGTWLF